MSRTAVALGLMTAVALPITGCGGSDKNNPKVSDASGFVTTCESKAKNPKTTNAQEKAFIQSHASEICKCIQQKLTAAGLGDKHYTDSALKNRPEPNQCAQQALQGSGG